MSVLPKFRTFFKIIKENGGVVGSFLKLYRTEELKDGTLVGQDKYGHKYYENKRYFIARSRWVDYADDVGMDYDGSQVPPEWHRWLHYMTDDPPTKVPPVTRKYILDHIENRTGTHEQYVPYSTTKPKVHAWQSPRAN
ncbi:hypothetical protein LSH36_119g00028 [Paralvinella palmiformis]|uniref:NADH dehydrogenase [ubiquinone] 1 alpha subcomplex subunit 12 n=1 Tax=Paralvinella palmiformis TaxID=53620 RepID=A0AAD9JYH0_9ANNE|nr:hypothetical protein LSH36_119g00028 [Paralvinella palmiformis]